jgi:hypothetical protein
VEIAVAEAVAVRHVGEAAQQGPPARLVQELGSGDVGRQPQFEAAELQRLVGMNACLQARQDLETCGDARRLVRIRSANDAWLSRSNTMPQRSPTCRMPQTAGTGSPSASTAAWIARFAERHPLGRRRSIELERTRAPFEHLGYIASGEQPPLDLLRHARPGWIS